MSTLEVMVVLGIAGFSAVAGALIWHKIIVPFDRMHQLSKELNDPGYMIAVPVERAPDPSPDLCPVAFCKDLQQLYTVVQGPVMVAPGKGNRR
jgi:hypothetical protein